PGPAAVAAPAPIAPAPAAVVAGAPPPARSPWRLTLDVGTLLEAARGSELAVGGVVRLAAGLPWVQGVVGLGALSAADVRRLPIDVGVRFVQEWGRVAISGDVGAAVAIQPSSYTELGPRRDDHGGSRSGLE